MEQPGQAFQILDPDHRHRAPVIVVEQASSDSVSFVLWNLVHDEEEPGDSTPRWAGPGPVRAEDDALPKTMACFASNIESNVACSLSDVSVLDHSPAGWQAVFRALVRNARLYGQVALPPRVQRRNAPDRDSSGHDFRGVHRSGGRLRHAI